LAYKASDVKQAGSQSIKNRGGFDGEQKKHQPFGLVLSIWG